MDVFAYLLMTSDIALILCGATMYWFSPRLRRNWILGYGSPRSMINDDSWQAANRFAGSALALLALAGMSLQVSAWRIITASELAQVATVASVLVLPFVDMFLTERYLARRFRS
jgi:uncharacterized membrane protein